MSTSQPASDSPPQLVLWAVVGGRLRTGCAEGRWFSSHLVPQDAEHAEGVSSCTWGSAHPVPPRMQSRWSSGEEAALVLTGVVAPVAPWCLLAPDPPAQRHFSSSWRRCCSASLGNLSAEASRWRLLSIPVIPMMLRSSWYCKQVHSSSAYLDNLTAARCLTRWSKPWLNTII